MCFSNVATIYKIGLLIRDATVGDYSQRKGNWGGFSVALEAAFPIMASLPLTIPFNNLAVGGQFFGREDSKI